jgi:hypothetical protein
MTRQSFLYSFLYFFPTLVYSESSMPKLSDDPLFNMPTASAAAAAKAGNAAPAGPSAPPNKKTPRDALYEPDYPYFATAFQDDFCYAAPWDITSVP